MCNAHCAYVYPHQCTWGDTRTNRPFFLSPSVSRQLSLPHQRVFEVYSSETSPLIQCVDGCNLATEKQSTRVKQTANRSKSHAKGKVDRKKVPALKTSKKKPSPSKKVTAKPASSPTPIPDLMPPILSLLPGALVHPHIVQTDANDSHDTVTTVTSPVVNKNAADSAKLLSPQLRALLMGSMLSSSQAHAVQAADWTDPMYKTPRQPLDSIERLLSNSLQMKVPQVPQSTFHLIKSSITLFTDDDTDSSDISDAHASPIPPEDALAQLKTTDSVYSESSDSSLMEPRVIIFGETDQELPIQPEIESHITRHIYKSPDETSFHKNLGVYQSFTHSRTTLYRLLCSHRPHHRGRRVLLCSRLPQNRIPRNCESQVFSSTGE